MRLHLALAVLCSAAAFADVPVSTVTEAETKRLEAGEVVVHPFTPTDNRGIGILSMGVVDAPSPEVFAVLRDCRHFVAFMPHTAKSVVVEEGGASVCHLELALPFPLSNLWSDTVAEEHEEPAGHYHRVWKQLRGTYTHNTGEWRALPWGERGAKTLVVYLLDSDPKMLIPDALLRSAQAGSLPALFAAVRERVVTLRQAAPH